MTLESDVLPTALHSPPNRSQGLLIWNQMRTLIILYLFDRCPHEGCNKLFYSEHCVGSHPRVHQQEQKELRCDFEGCGRVFEKQCRLTQHQRSHTGEKPYVCDYEVSTVELQWLEH